MLSAAGLIALVPVAVIVMLRELVRRRMLRGMHGSLRAQALAFGAGTLIGVLGVLATGFAFGACLGRRVESHYQVTEVIDGFDAKDKLRPGDVIVAANGRRLDAYLWPSLQETVAEVAPREVVLSVARDGAVREVAVVPRASERREGPAWLLGIKTGVIDVRDRSVGTIARIAVTYPVHALSGSVRSVTRVDEAESGGPKRITTYVYPMSFTERTFQAMVLLAVYALLALVVADLARWLVAAMRAGAR